MSRKPGAVHGVHRTWLARDGIGKAPVATPRRAMGRLLGNGVRFGAVMDAVAVGEGIETMLALRCVLPSLPMIAALSANHLAALMLPLGSRRLYIAMDNDDAGAQCAMALAERAERQGIEAIALSPSAGDFNEDFCSTTMAAPLVHLRLQIAPEDVQRFLIMSGCDPSSRQLKGEAPA